MPLNRDGRTFSPLCPFFQADNGYALYSVIRTNSQNRAISLHVLRALNGQVEANVQYISVMIVRNRHIKLERQKGFEPST
jgi:hypothetical protein